MVPVDFRNFGGVGNGKSNTVLAEVDTLQFEGDGLTARNMLLTEEDSNLVIGFEGIQDVEVRLQDFDLEDLDNLSSPLVPQTTLAIFCLTAVHTLDSFDVANANSESGTGANPDTVTFLNDLDNKHQGLENSK